MKKHSVERSNLKRMRNAEKKRKNVLDLSKWRMRRDDKMMKRDEHVRLRKLLIVKDLRKSEFLEKRRSLKIRRDFSPRPRQELKKRRDYARRKRRERWRSVFFKSRSSVRRWRKRKRNSNVSN